MSGAMVSIPELISWLVHGYAAHLTAHLSYSTAVWHTRMHGADRVKHLLQSVVPVHCCEGIVEPKLHGSVGHDLQEGDGDATVQASDALLSHDACSCIHDTPIYLQAFFFGYKPSHRGVTGDHTGYSKCDKRTLGSP